MNISHYKQLIFLSVISLVCLLGCGPQAVIESSNRVIDFSLISQGTSQCSENTNNNLSLTKQINPSSANWQKELRAYNASRTDQVVAFATEGQHTVKVDSNNNTHVKLNFKVNQIKLCNYQAKLHVTANDSFVKGRIPDSIADTSRLKWSRLELALKTELASSLNLDLSDLKSFNHVVCIYDENDQIYPAWNIKSTIKNKSYSALMADIDGRLKTLEVITNDFHNVGISYVYDRKPSEENRYSIKKYKINHMKGSGFLCSDLASTVIPKGYSLAFDQTFEYTYAPTDSQFAELSAFTHVSEMWDWFIEKLGEREEKNPVQVRLDNSARSQQSGPVYIHPSFSNRISVPTIILPTHFLSTSGDKLLQNLNLDPDPVGHELGHHIIFEHVGLSSNEEHKAIHEALSDFFVMAKSQSPCLGPSICTQSIQSICASGNQCLRRADNSYVLNTPEYENLEQFHRKSQIISGLLWDIGETLGLDYAADLSLQALQWMSYETDYRDLIGALFVADRENHNSQNFCTLKELAEARGFAHHVADFTCNL